MEQQTHITDLDAFNDLVSKVEDIEAAEEASFAVASLAGMDAEELQKFLEEKSGINPDEEAQGSVMAAAASIAFHC